MHTWLARGSKMGGKLEDYSILMYHVRRRCVMVEPWGLLPGGMVSLRPPAAGPLIARVISRP